MTRPMLCRISLSALLPAPTPGTGHLHRDANQGRQQARRPHEARRRFRDSGRNARLRTVSMSVGRVIHLAAKGTDGQGRPHG